MLTITDIDLLPDNLLVSHYLLASFLYYQMDQSPMLDLAYDHLCQRLSDRWDDIRHPHKHLVEKGGGNSEAKTCLLKYDDFPMIVKSASGDYLIHCISGRMSDELRSRYGERRQPPASRLRISRTRPAKASEEPPKVQTTTKRVRRTRPAR